MKLFRLCVSVDVELVEEERKTKQKDDQSFKATWAFYTARNSVAVLIPKYLILARLTGVCSRPERSRARYQPAQRGEASTNRTATAGANCSGAVQAGKPGERGRRARQPPSFRGNNEMSCSAYSQFKTTDSR
ncbi:hypothetical protein fugu_016408 [Takifugu bimaculatus]|uniref:Uncharacterized protein n=1 Tax=Takifugu bimaculatus TaxID=433685 RepID=A0A4Z2BSW5_9TELE|nr:hypothetical protein fugu_016408 [Takifugu bimaculatus]